MKVTITNHGHEKDENGLCTNNNNFIYSSLNICHVDNFGEGAGVLNVGRDRCIPIDLNPVIFLNPVWFNLTLSRIWYFQLFGCRIKYDNKCETKENARLHKGLETPFQCSTLTFLPICPMGNQFCFLVDHVSFWLPT